MHRFYNLFQLGVNQSFDRPRLVNFPRKAGKNSDEEEAARDEELTEVIEAQIRDAHGELRFGAEGIEYEDDIGGREQHRPDGIEPARRRRRGDEIADGHRRHQYDRADIEHAENLEGKLDLHRLEYVCEDGRRRDHADNGAERKIHALRYQRREVQYVSREERRDTGKEDLLPHLFKGKAQIEQHVADAAEDESDEDEPCKGRIPRRAEGYYTYDDEDQRGRTL